MTTIAKAIAIPPVSGIGSPLSRLDGRPKTTGGARYAADTPIKGVLHGALVSATIASGRLRRLETRKAGRAPGVVRIFTHRNMPRIPKLQAPPAGESLTPMQNDRIRYEGQFIALVVAETLEQAQRGAELLEVEYVPEQSLTDFTRARDRAFTAVNWTEPDTTVGDVDAGLARAEVRIEQVYRTADRHHNPMEPSATVAEWRRRSPTPRSMRQGHDLIGWGMASALMPTFRNPASARITLEPAGSVLIEAGTQEIGTGVYTILPQIAGDVLGIPAERIQLVLGDTTLPETGITAGSSTTMGAGSAVQDAATGLKRRLAELAGGSEPPAEDYGELLRDHGLERLSAEGKWSLGANASPTGEVPEWTMQTFGALFAEVRVDADLPIPRLTRCVGVYSAGRIVNPKTARSQMTGGMIWGAGQALLEESTMDHSLGRYLSKNLAGYLVPVSADIPALGAEFVDEIDPHASSFGGRGIGELGAVGVGAAIANAVYHATGVRVRQVPIRPEMLMQGELMQEEGEGD